MSNILAGFVKGFADTTRGGLERREEEERELRKAKLLNELRMATEKEMTLFKENTPAAREERERARRGETRAQALHERTFERDKIGDERWEREFNQRELHNRRSLDAYGRAGRGGGSGSSSSPMTTRELGKELIYQNKDLVADMKKRNPNLTQMEIEELAINVMREVKGTSAEAIDEDANNRFRRFLLHMSNLTKPKDD